MSALKTVVLALGVMIALPVAAQTTPPTVDDNGTISGPITPLPVSDFLSPEAKAQLIAKLKNPPSFAGGDDIATVRKRFADSGAKVLERWQKIYPSKIESTTMGGVHVYVVTPNAGIDPKNKHRVLINAHRGGFATDGEYGGQIEAIAQAGRGRIKVIALDYRMAPEFTFPAASEDLEAVYREVLKTTKPANIGLYGCSAGGTLTAESIPWFLKKKLPLPGAIGIFCSGAMKGLWRGGDSSQLSVFVNGNPPAAPTTVAPYRGYFDGVDPNNPLVTPGLFPEVLAEFPPTLLVTATRDMALSNAVVTHAHLLQAGIDARLYVQEGLGHGHFFNSPGTPESFAAQDVIWNFFDSHLGK